MSDLRWDGLAVTKAGSGPAVLWLHGYTMSSAVWAPLWARLPGWKHLGVDLPGHGASRGLRDAEDLPALADAIADRAAAAAVRHVVALSFGTVLGVELAIRHPDLVDSWTFAAPAFAGMPHEPPVAECYRELTVAYAAGERGSKLRQRWMSEPPPIFAGVNRRPSVRAGLAAIIDRHRWVELADGGMRRMLTRPQRAGELAGVRVPVQVIIGDEEMLMHRACARSIAAAVPAATVTVMPGCGHLPLLEEPVAAAEVLAAGWSAALSRSPSGADG